MSALSEKAETARKVANDQFRLERDVERLEAVQEARRRATEWCIARLHEPPSVIDASKSTKGNTIVRMVVDDVRLSWHVEKVTEYALLRPSWVDVDVMSERLYSGWAKTRVFDLTTLGQALDDHRKRWPAKSAVEIEEVEITFDDPDRPIWVARPPREARA